MADRILVTGATGFLGGRLANTLHNQGYEVTGTGRNKAKGELLKCEFQQADLTDLDRIKELVRGKDYVFHCGAMSTLWGRYSDFYKANVLGTRNIALACVDASARMIHVSTPAIYFNLQDKLDVKEDSPLPSPVNNYSRTKLEGERILDSLEGLEIITIRPRGIFGEGDNAIFPRFIKANERGIPFINGGIALTDLTYVDNVVDSMILCKDAFPLFTRRKYNITNGEPVQIGEVITRAFKKIGIPLKRKNLSYPIARVLCPLIEGIGNLTRREPIMTRYSLSILSKSQTLNIDSARRDLGYIPRVSLEEGLERFASWWKQQ